ncbi:MAG: translation initiation factor IF-2 N-terminal domain-containing protein, partial [Candidatus Rokuibacteriota bacterium]
MAAAKIKVIELAKELGVTSKDIMLAAEEMGRKGVRAMTALDTTFANDLRVKLGKGRDIPEEVRPKRPLRARTATPEGGEGEAPKKAARPRKPRAEVPGDAAGEPIELKPAATIVKPKPAEKVPEPAIEAPEPVVPVAEAIEVKPVPVVPEVPVSVKPLAAPPSPPRPAGPPKPEPKIVPFRPLERSAPPPPPARPVPRQPAPPFAPPRVVQ